MAKETDFNSSGGKPLTQADYMRLFMQHEPALRAYARSLLPDWYSVDEVIQEASITLWEKFDQLRDEAGFLPWAKVTVRFKCLSSIATRRRDRHLFSDKVMNLIADEADEIDDELQARARRTMHACLKKFSEEHQALLLAPYTDGGQVKAIAKKMGKSSNALYKVLGRLRAKLSACVHKHMEVAS